MSQLVTGATNVRYCEQLLKYFTDIYTLNGVVKPPKAKAFVDPRNNVAYYSFLFVHLFFHQTSGNIVIAAKLKDKSGRPKFNINFSYTITIFQIIQ